MNPIVDKNGTQRWVMDGVLHREDGPAAIYKNGTRDWWFDGNT